jgi:hypothetical protein
MVFFIQNEKPWNDIGPCHVSGNFLPFKGKSRSLSSQAARFFSFAKGIFPLLQRNPAHMTPAIVTVNLRNNATFA